MIKIMRLCPSLNTCEIIEDVTKLYGIGRIPYTNYDEIRLYGISNYYPVFYGLGYKYPHLYEGLRVYYFYVDIERYTDIYLDDIVYAEINLKHKHLIEGTIEVLLRDEKINRLLCS